MSSTLSEITHIYCDGGCILKNPSIFGGVWAFVLVKNNILIEQHSGVVETIKGRLFTNNWSEQIAMIKGLEYMPENWSGIMCCDSKIALGRMFENWRCKNLPKNIEQRMKDSLKRLGKVYWQHVGGHPTKEDLARGYNEKGHPVSKFNVLCDSLCNQEIENYLSLKGITNAHIVNSTSKEECILQRT